jgi:hypothetical protein
VSRNASEQPSFESVERQDWHLWLLSTLMIFLLGVSLLSFMFPTVFWSQDGFVLQAPQRAFAGFCVLLMLLLTYLAQRQSTVRRLRRQVFEARAMVLELERHGKLLMFQALPGSSQFEDMLAMEYRRAATSNTPLAVVLLPFPKTIIEQVGRAASLIHPMLRKGEHLFRLSDRELATIHPGMSSAAATDFSQHLNRLIATETAMPEPVVVSYPEGVASLSGIKREIRRHHQDSSGLAAVQ